MTEDYTEQSLDIIEHNQMLETKELNALKKIGNDLEHNFWLGQVFRSRVEMEISVLSDLKYPTADGKYWQSIREQNVHFNELVSLSYQYRKKVQGIKILGCQLDRMKDELVDLCEAGAVYYDKEELKANIEIKEIEIEQDKWSLTSMIRVAKNRVREILGWQDIMAKLKPHMKHSLYTYEEHQLNSYIERFKGNTKSGLGVHTTAKRVADGDGIQLGADERMIKDGK
jgi:hypothetical protein